MIGPGDVVVVALARDLAAGVVGKPLRITASGAIAREAAAYWREALPPAGQIVVGLEEGELDGSVRIHLHEEAAAPSSYSATGLAIEDLSSDLVGEVIGQGGSAGDRYSSLIAVADALAAALADAATTRGWEGQRTC